MAIDWVMFPQFRKPTQKLLSTVECFERNEPTISSLTNNLDSDQVLETVTGDLQNAGFKVELGKKLAQQVRIPVLYGDKGIPRKEFRADAFDPEEGIVVEVEAGRAFTNYHFLKDIFEASMMLDAKFLCIAVRKTYKGSKDYIKVRTFLETLYASERLKLPLEGLLLIGY
jgi:hypothetical protein